MKTMRKILSLLIAIVLSLGTMGQAFAAEEDPVAASPAVVGNLDGKVQETAPEKTKVVVHKLMAEEYIDEIPLDHNGGVIEDLSKLGKQVTEVNGVEFTYFKVTAEQLDKLMETPANYATVEQVQGLDNLQVAGTITTGNGQGASIDLEEGFYWFVESSMPATLTVAGGTVPFGISLPLSNGEDVGNIKAGTGFLTEVNIYPKNLNEKPETTKELKDKEKATKGVTVGDVVNYVVNTTIPAGTRYKTAHWSDQMTEGLTFNKDSLKITVGEQVLTENTHYTLTTDNNSFNLKLNEEGLKLINDQKEKVSVTIEYNATLNEKAVVEIPESNDVMFHYGNNEDHGNTPIPTKPVNGEIYAEKTWADGQAPEGVEVTFELINAQTGETKDSYTLQNAETSHTFTGLDNDIEYKVKEKYNGYSAEYSVVEDGKIKVTNHKDNNPEPNNPQAPKVKTFGKKFVKTGNAGDRLEGAEFIVYRTVDGGKEYLVRKDEVLTSQDLNAYLEAEKAYQDAVKQGGNVYELRKARDEKFAAKNMQWTWDKDVNKAVAFISNESGQFEVYGLETGTYNLHETKSPAGYALLTKDIEFKVGEGTYAEGDIDFVKESGKNDAQNVKNNKVTIPQTGGIGTAIFAIVGIAIMGGAVVAMKKRNEVYES